VRSLRQRQDGPEQRKRRSGPFLLRAVNRPIGLDCSWIAHGGSMPGVGLEGSAAVTSGRRRVKVWAPAEAIGSVTAATVAARAAHQSSRAASEANAAATTLAELERDRRHGELCPRLRVSCEPRGSGTHELRLWVMLLGPPTMDRVDSLTVKIRDDHFRRGDGCLLAGGPTREQIKEQIWGPYRFTPGVAPDQARSDRTGRVIVYETSVPVGEDLPVQLEPTSRSEWATATSPEDWRREQGTVIRLVFLAEHTQHGKWTLPAEIDIGGMTTSVTVNVPQP
jgi:hypothetical protein